MNERGKSSENRNFRRENKKKKTKAVTFPNQVIPTGKNPRPLFSSLEKCEKIGPVTVESYNI